MNAIEGVEGMRKNIFKTTALRLRIHHSQGIITHQNTTSTEILD